MRVDVRTESQGFNTSEFVVYPAHGVGQILAIEEQVVAGAKLELFVINFVKDKMTLRVPTAKIANVGMRKLSEPALVKQALETLKGLKQCQPSEWSVRAQEYEAKINSGDIVAIAEVVRDLYGSESHPEQAYSERQLYEAALDRLSREIAVVQHMTEADAVREIEGYLGGEIPAPHTVLGSSHPESTTLGNSRSMMFGAPAGASETRLGASPADRREQPMRGILLWGILYSVCAFVAWLVLGAIYLLTLYLAYLSSFPALLCALFLVPFAQLYWIWWLWGATGNFFHFLTMMCLVWVALRGIQAVAAIKLANWTPQNSH